MAVLGECDCRTGMAHPLVALEVLAVKGVHLVGGEGIIAEAFSQRVEIVDQRRSAGKQVGILCLGKAHIVRALLLHGLGISSALDAGNHAVPLGRAHEDHSGFAGAGDVESTFALPVILFGFANLHVGDDGIVDGCGTDVDGSLLVSGIDGGYCIVAFVHLGGERRRCEAGELYFVFRIRKVQIYCKDFFLLAGEFVLAGEMIVGDAFAHSGGRPLRARRSDHLATVGIPGIGGGGATAVSVAISVAAAIVDGLFIAIVGRSREVHMIILAPAPVKEQGKDSNNK